jgi:hypothetical protein
MNYRPVSELSQGILCVVRGAFLFRLIPGLPISRSSCFPHCLSGWQDGREKAEVVEEGDDILSAAAGDEHADQLTAIRPVDLLNWSRVWSRAAG